MAYFVGALEELSQPSEEEEEEEAVSEDDARRHYCLLSRLQ